VCQQGLEQLAPGLDVTDRGRGHLSHRCRHRRQHLGYFLIELESHHASTECFGSGGCTVGVQPIALG